MSKKILSFDDIVSRSIVIRMKPDNAKAQLTDDDLRAKPIDEFLGDREAGNRVLAALGIDDIASVDALRFAKDSADGPQAPKGIGLIGVNPFVEAFNARFRYDNPKPDFRVKVGGKIRDHIFIPNPSDPSKGRGHLSVDVLHEFFETDEDLRACKPNKTEFYHWDIEIGRYEVHRRYDLIEELKKEHQHFPKKPFPTLPDVAFPESALDPDDPRSIWCRCLDHKLYAKGEHVKVEHVYRQVCNHPADASDEDFHLLDRNDPKYADYYKQTDDACVDIMFAGYPPLAGLPKQREYCLGRCGNPDIVNTGA